MIKRILGLTPARRKEGINVFSYLFLPFGAVSFIKDLLDIEYLEKVRNVQQTEK